MHQRCGSGPQIYRWGELVSLQGGWWSLHGVWWILVEQPRLGSFRLRTAAWGNAAGFGLFALSGCLLFQLRCSLTVADRLSTSKRLFTLNYGRIKQRQAFNWAAI